MQAGPQKLQRARERTAGPWQPSQLRERECGRVAAPSSIPHLSCGPTKETHAARPPWRKKVQPPLPPVFHNLALPGVRLLLLLMEHLGPEYMQLI